VGANEGEIVELVALSDYSERRGLDVCFIEQGSQSSCRHELMGLKGDRRRV
jgi:hypothetical protein